MPKITNEVLLEKIEGGHEITQVYIKGIHERLDTLNSQTQKNTAFRNSQRVINGVVTAIGVAILGVVARILLMVLNIPA